MSRKHTKASVRSWGVLGNQSPSSSAFESIKSQRSLIFPHQNYKLDEVVEIFGSKRTLPFPFYLNRTHSLSLQKLLIMLPSVLFTSTLDRLTTRCPMLAYAAVWTALLTLTVAMASFTPEIAFVSVISSSSSSSSTSRVCETDSYIRVPLDLPGEIFCLPAHRFMRSKIDFIVPPIFAAVIVAGSAFLVRAVALWESDVVH